MVRINRRHFLRLFAVGLVGMELPVLASNNQVNNVRIKPVHLKRGDTIGLISPGSFIGEHDLDFMIRFLTENGFKYKLGNHVFDRYGYLAGTDIDRAADVNSMFADQEVKAILTTRGGWGCNRILDLLNYNLIGNNPKIIMGYSDITSLLLAIYAQTGLITFHGAVAISNWNAFTINYIEKLLLNRELITFKNSPEIAIQTINSGKAQGILLGGNLSVIVSMIGSNYLPKWQNTILFVEDIGEDIYRIDRMLTQLKLAGILKQVSGFIFAQCTDCSTGENNEPSLTLQEILNTHIKPLNIPSWYGSMIGHIQDKFTLPIGIKVEINTNQGTIQMLEEAVNRIALNY